MRGLNEKGCNARNVDVVLLASIRYEINPGNFANIIGGNGNRTTSASAPNPPLAGTIGGSLGSGMFRENLCEVTTQRHAGKGRRLWFASGRYNSRQHERYHRFDPFCPAVTKIPLRLCLTLPRGAATRANAGGEESATLP
jgi:hypothetical protein